MNVSERLQAWSLNTVFVSSGERQHLHADSEPDVWRRDEWLGSGGFGDVFKETCVDGPRRRQIRAVKRVRKSPTAMRLVQRELDVLVDCATDNNKHESREHFVRFLGWFGDNTHLYVAMELVPFGDLQSHITTKPCSEKSTAIIIGQVGRALQYMHERNFVHRDLKPANILVARPRPDWHVKLTDFGISKNLDNTELQTRVGTEAYMAPELFNQKDTDTRFTSAVDVWSLGAVAFCVRTGKAPFENIFELCKFSSGTIRFPTQPLMRSSGAFVDFIFSLMEKAPEGRPTMLGVLEHEWMRRGGLFCSVTRNKPLEPDPPAGEWEAQATAVWHTSMPPTSQASIPSDQLTFPNVTTSAASIPRTLSMRRSSDRHRKSAPSELGTLSATIPSPTREQDPESVHKELWNTFERSRSPSTCVPPPNYARILPERVRKEARDTHERTRPFKAPNLLDIVTKNFWPIQFGPVTSIIPTPSDMAQRIGTSLEEVEPQWDTPGWLQSGQEVKVKVVLIHPFPGKLDSMIDTSDYVWSGRHFLFRHSVMSDQETGAAIAGYARLSPLMTNYIFTGEGRHGRRSSSIHLKIQAIARAFALEFNSLISQGPIIDFLMVPIVACGSGEYLYLEDYEYARSGSFIRYNGDSGFVNPNKDDKLNKMAQAFSHFTSDRSEGRFLVCNLQGHGGLLINPVIHSLDRERLNLDTNLGSKGFKAFFSTHDCNGYCFRLGLKSPRRHIFELRQPLREDWSPKVAEVSYCSNRVCGRILCKTSVKKSGTSPPQYWCNQCGPQIESSIIRRVCPGPGPHHEFGFSELFYEVQGLGIPTMCPEHWANHLKQTATIPEQDP